MSQKCYRCFRPLASCYCGHIVPLDPGITFVFLMHPREAYRQKTGTGRLASLSLAGSELIVGIDFTRNERLNALLADPSFAPYVLYPSPGAVSAEDPGLPARLGGKRLLVIVIDATWFFAKKMLKASENLQALPALSFRSDYRSRFIFKTQPRPECLSTIESAYYLIKELQRSGIARKEADPEPLMEVFSKMVRYQLECEQARHEAEAAELYPGLFASENQKERDER